MQTTMTCTTCAPVQTRSIWRLMLDVVVRADARHRDRHAFKNLPDHLRRDIGQLPKTAWTPPEIMRSNSLW